MYCISGYKEVVVGTVCMDSRYGVAELHVGIALFSLLFFASTLFQRTVTCQLYCATGNKATDAGPVTGTTTYPTDVEADDDEGPIIKFPSNRMLRRTSRHHRQRDLGPVAHF